MFGAYRLLLAIMVMESHLLVAATGSRYHWNYVLGLAGRIGVINFFVISGLVMTKLYQKHFVSLDKAPEFYLERALRILPQYFFFLLLTAVLMWFFGPSESRIGYPPTFSGVVANILIVPLDFYMFDSSIRNYMLIPQAFTLGVEILFYLILPLLVIFRRLRFAVLLCSAIIFLLAFLNIINNDYFGYRLLPGTLIFFLMGICMADAKSPHAKIFLIGSYAFFLALACVVAWNIAYAGVHSWLVTPTNVSVLIGIIAGAPVIYFLSMRPANSWDSLIGSASYGVFLCHMLVIWWSPIILLRVGLAFDFGRMPVFIGSILLGYAAYRFIERPFVRIRHRIREKNAGILCG